MSDRHSIAQARSNLPRLVREAERGKAVELTRRGEPVAVLLGLRQFEQLVGRRHSFWQAYQAFLEQVDLEEADLDPDVLFSAARDSSTGRDVTL